jgi:transcriptional regulator with XRE-family HTH domain
MKLGEIIRKYRLHQELTIRELAKDIGVGTATLHRIENGENMDGDTLSKIVIWMLKETE